MKQLVFFFIFFLSGQALAATYSKHWYGDIPKPLNSTKSNILLFYDLFVAQFDSEKKFSRWVAYQISPQLVWGSGQQERKFKPDHYLNQYHSKQALTSRHYKGASRFHYDRGHLAPLGSFKSSAFSYQLQYLSNIVPQRVNLNRGPWKLLESKIRTFVLKGHEVRLLTGPLYGDSSYGKPYKKNLAPWGGIPAQIIPSGFWKIISFKNAGSIEVCAFLMPQNVPNQKQPLKQYIVKQKVLKEHVGLEFLKGLKTQIKNGCHFLN